MEALGYIMHWGYSPAINFFNGVDNVEVTKDEDEINVLIAQCGGDIRHVLKTIADILPMENSRTKPINIYIHEKPKENLARTILFLTLISDTRISQRERMEIFLDLFGNCLIRDKTSEYLEEAVKELIYLVTEDDKCKSPLKELINFDTLKFKERDEIEDVFSSYLKAHPYDIEKHRDQRLRYHFADRYDHRRNLVDWDYQMNLREYAEYVHQLQYREWRLSGIAFETRLANGTIPNRTMSSYAYGKTKKEKDSCQVRGYFGDIVNSPYLSFGQEIYKEPENTYFKKHVNYQKIYSNADISEYNVQQYIQKLEDLDDFEFPFERLKSMVPNFDTDNPSKMSRKNQKLRKEKEAAEKKKLEEIKEEEEPMIEEITDEQAAKIEEDKKQAEEQKEAEEKVEQIDSSSKGKTMEKCMEDIEKQVETIDLKQIDEGTSDAKEGKIGEPRTVLKGFEMSKVKFHLLSDDVEKIFGKQKYAELFDVGVLSVHSANVIDNEDVNKIFKKGANIHIESSDQIVMMTKEQRVQFRQAVADKCVKAQWKQAEEAPYKHHMLYKVDK